MGKRHSTPQGSPLWNQGKPRQTSQASVALRVSFKLLLYMSQRHPFLFWTGTWLVMVLFACISIRGLLHINLEPLPIVENPNPEVVVQAPQPKSQLQPPTSASSFGLLATVALSCAATSVLLARQLRPVKPTPRRAVKRSVKFQSAQLPPPPKAISPLPNSQGSARQAPSGIAHQAQPRTSTPPVPSPASLPKVAQSTPDQPLKTQLKTQQSPQQLTVTVVPTNESHPLDWGENDVAAMMDIRKRRSLSSYL